MVSFTVYSLLQRTDAWSTRRYGKLDDLRVAEASWLLTAIAAKVGFKKAIRIVWLLIGIPVAAYDTIFPSSFDIPSTAILIGFTHLAAATHNYQLYGYVQILTKEEIRSRTKRLAEHLSQLNRLQRLAFVFERNAVALFTTGMVIVIASAVSHAVSQVTCNGPPPITPWFRLARAFGLAQPCDFFSYLGSLLLLSLFFSTLQSFVATYDHDDKLLRLHRSGKLG